MRYYKVMAERGHCGTGKSVDMVFYFKAPSAYDALCRGKKMPAIKHSRVPLLVKEVDAIEYNNNIKVSAYRR